MSTQKSELPGLPDSTQRSAPPIGPFGLARLLVLAAVAVFFAPTLDIPFIGDDYIFLDKTRLAGFVELWSRTNTDFGWYRPWSREFYFWVIQHLAGANPVAFRTANVALWVASIFLFSEVVRRISSTRIAVVVLVGVATLGLWGAPLLWISGSQDLWMFFFVSVALWCVVTGRNHWALLAYVGALLSKETSAVFPLFAIALWKFSQKRRLRSVAVRAVPFAIVTGAWFVFHPMLLRRLMDAGNPAPGTELPLPAWQVVIKTGLAVLNADQLGDAFMPTPGIVLATSIGGLLLAVAMWLATSGAPPLAGKDERRSLMWVGGCWAAAGWLPLFLPSISWHAYYGCLGATGAWVLLAAWLGGSRRLMMGVVVLVGTLRIFNSSSRAWDWGSEWYQRRAGLMLGSIQAQLMNRYPSLPPNSRVYFGSIPNNIGLIAGNSPALRVWYRDSTLKAGFYSYYRARTSTEPAGRDLFFHFDSTRGLQEIFPGPEDVRRAVQLDPDWEANHLALANMFLRAGDPARAAEEIEKVAQLPGRPEAFAYAALCHEVAGDSSRAHRLFLIAAEQMGGTQQQFTDWVAITRRGMPRPGQ